MVLVYGAACGVRHVSGYLSTLMFNAQGLGLTPALCKSVPNGKPEAVVAGSHLLLRVESNGS